MTNPIYSALAALFVVVAAPAVAQTQPAPQDNAMMQSDTAMHHTMHHEKMVMHGHMSSHGHMSHAQMMHWCHSMSHHKMMMNPHCRSMMHMHDHGSMHRS